MTSASPMRKEFVGRMREASDEEVGQRTEGKAVERAERVGKCGWDQRLVFGDEEVAEFGDQVWESYENEGEGAGAKEGADAMDVDGDAQAEEGEWWCTGKKKCERHNG